MRKRISGGQWFCLAMAVILAICAAAAYLTDTTTTESFDGLISRHKQGVGMLTGQSPVQQTFQARRGKLSAVSVMTSTYNKKLREGTLSLTLTDGEGAVLAEQTYEVSALKNNAFVTLKLPAPIKDSEGKTFALHASSTCTEEKGVTLRMGPLEGADGAAVLTLTDGTTDTENALNLRCTYTDTVYGLLSGAALLLAALCFAACVPLSGRKERG